MLLCIALVCSEGITAHAADNKGAGQTAVTVTEAYEAATELAETVPTEESSAEPIETPAATEKPSAEPEETPAATSGKGQRYYDLLWENKQPSGAHMEKSTECRKVFALS